MLKAEVNQLLTDRYGKECGIERISADGKIFQEHGPVISATGCFGAEFAPDPVGSKHLLPVALADDQWRSFHRQGLEEVHGHGT